MRLQVEPDHYWNEIYDTKERFISYWHQIDEVVKLNPKKVLEIGIGNGFVSSYLKNRTIDIITLDIDGRLNPDVVGSVLNIPFPDNYFEVVACYEVLEHLPYESFNAALCEIHRVCKSNAVLSLPDINRACSVYVQIPRIGFFKKIIPLPKLKRPRHNHYGEHYWEIGEEGHPLKRIVGDIQKCRFKIDKTYRVFEHFYHRFFILGKNL